MANFAPEQRSATYKGKWTFPYFSCSLSKWILSYSIEIPTNHSHSHGLRGFISVDIDVSGLRVNQCEPPLVKTTMLFEHPHDKYKLAVNEVVSWDAANDIQVFYRSHKCHRDTMRVSKPDPLITV